jgi:hypothetical protein
MSSPSRSPVNWRALFGPSPGKSRSRRPDPKDPGDYIRGGASESFDMLLPCRAGGAVAVRRTLASTICRIADPTQAPRPRRLRDASTVMRSQSAHQSMINRRLDDRASCRARQSLEQVLPMEPRMHAPASCNRGHESGSNLTFGTHV